MKTTISVIGAGVGSFPGTSRAHPRLLEEAAKRLREQEGGLLTDSFVSRCGDGLELVMTHARGAGDDEVHGLARDVLRSCAEIATGMRLHGREPDLPATWKVGRDGVRGAGVGAGAPVHGRRSAGGRLELSPLQDIRRPVHHARARERPVDAGRVRLRGPRPRRAPEGVLQDAGGVVRPARLHRRAVAVSWSGTSSRRGARSRPRPRSGAGPGRGGRAGTVIRS